MRIALGLVEFRAAAHWMMFGEPALASLAAARLRTAVTEALGVAPTDFDESAPAAHAFNGVPLSLGQPAATSARIRGAPGPRFSAA